MKQYTGVPARLASFLIVSLLVSSCAVTVRQPIVYTQPANHVYEIDLRHCEAFAREATSSDPTALDGAVNGGIGGALIGAALGAMVGGMLGMPGRGAAWGTALGAGRGFIDGAAVNAAELDRRQKTAVITCLRAEGYSDATY